MQSNDFKNRIKYNNPDQQDIHEKIMSLLDEYQKNNSFENREFLCYLTAAIFLTYKKLYPQLSIYIPFRTKGDTSYINNIQKEFSKFMEDLNSNTSFDTSSITKDISGIKIVLDNINFSLPPKGESTKLFSNPEIGKLLYESHENFHFIDEVDEYLQSSIQNGKKYYELKKDLLKKIIDITPKEFTEERKPNPTFSKLYEDTIYQYNYFLENDCFPTIVSDFEINELTNLLNDFRSRIHDQLHFSILRETLPVVFEDPLIKNVLKTSFEWNKESIKENGFQAIYYTLHTPFGAVEVQAQSNKAYYASTKGSAYHSGMEGKTINVKDFFELVDENDKHDITYYLDILDSISADSMISPYEIPEFKTKQEEEDFFRTSRGAAYLESEKYREMMTHIRIKQKMQILPQHLPKDVYNPKNPKEIDSKKLQELIDCGKIKPFIFDTNDYLFSTALALSPYMNVCSSGHTSYTNAGIHHKKVIGEFAEVLRKKDSNTCLRDLLIRRLEDLIENNGYLDSVSLENPNLNMNISLQKVKEHDEIATKLPKDISTKNIIRYGEKLRNMEKANSELDLSKE